MEAIEDWVRAAIEDWVRAAITGVFRVSGENDNGRRVVSFCAERGLYVGNTDFKDESLHKYMRLKDEME